MTLQITPIGAATALLEIGSLRLLTDPAFDPAGTSHSIAGLARSKRTAPPALSADEVGPLDAVLLSHDHHFDNLDHAGRALLPSAGRVLTTRAGARRLGGNSEGLGPWDAVELGELRVTATPARHGPPGLWRIIGETTGFVLEWPGQQHGAVWWSGDTRWFEGLVEVGERFDVGTALINVGGAMFPATGPIRYTPRAAEAVKMVEALRPRLVVPLHYEGWSHFREGRERAEAAFAEGGVADRVRWLPLGEATELEV